ncbi:flavin reductase family protein [Granulosicoccus sp. 3-233]|uniref:flavin reductase family protein n=1 Tax=Granulosicoccus sp. 3-233 TaxID=3417969 RepID=UPI003D331D4E
MSVVQMLETPGGAVPLVSDEIWSAENGSSRDLRHAFGRFATGVTVITIDSPEGPYGMTVNSFSSVSLDPALVLWSVDRKSARCPYFLEASHFVVNILGAGQTDMALGFARDPFAFDDASWHESASGLPVLNNCAATLECKREAVHPGGDHFIIVGQVTRACVAECEPLLFYKGDFGAMA